MDQLGCKRYCCRRMIMTHVDLIEKLLKFVLDLPDRLAGRALANTASRYTPDGRGEKKIALANQ